MRRPPATIRCGSMQAVIKIRYIVLAEASPSETERCGDAGNGAGNTVQIGKEAQRVAAPASLLASCVAVVS